MNRDELIEKMADALEFGTARLWSATPHRAEILDAASAMLTAIEAAGVALVPVEATREMVSAGISERHDAPEIARQAWTMATANIYRAMLAASPYRRDSDDK